MCGVRGGRREVQEGKGDGRSVITARAVILFVLR